MRQSLPFFEKECNLCEFGAKIGIICKSLLGILTGSEGGQVRPRLVIELLVVGFQTEIHQSVGQLGVCLSFVCVEERVGLFLTFC